MPYLTANGTRLFYRDWGAGRPVVFVTSWGLSSRMWQNQMLHMVGQGHRAIGYDRRGHGRSDDPGRDYDFDTLADDLAALLDELDLADVTLVGHSMGGGEVVRYLSRHGGARIGRIALVASTVPCLMRSADNPIGVDGALLEGTVAAIRDNFGQWILENSPPFWGDCPAARELPQPIKDWTIRDMMDVSAQAAVECTRANIAADFRPELPGIEVPALVVAGGQDVSAPVELCGRPSAELLPNARLEIYPDAAHALYLTHRDRLNADLVALARETAPGATRNARLAIDKLG